ncbi:MAG: hypothetical protein ACPL7J_14710 [Desulfomonilaceae bacterium]
MRARTKTQIPPKDSNGLRMEVAAMPLRNFVHDSSNARPFLSRSRFHLVAILALLAVLLLGTSLSSLAEPLEYSPRWSLGFETTLSTIEGRMGFDQQNAGYGTLNDLKADLGLPNDNRTFKIQGSVRPLEHHLLRAFGTIPEAYLGSKTLNKNVRLTRLPNPNAFGQTDLVVTFPTGSNVLSELKYASFGMGYDLDFLVAPRWSAGIAGELRYLDVRLKLWGENAQDGLGQNIGRVEDVINIDEMFPCVGGHANVAFPFGMNAMSPLNIGGFTKMSFGLSPNYLNYVDLSMGLSVWTGPRARMQLMAKVGVEHESVFHDAANRNGRVFELKRNGLLISLDGTF